MATIQEKRLEKGWSQQILAVEAGVAYATVSRAEKGEPVQRISLDRICTALEIRLDEVEGYAVHDALGVAKRWRAARRESKRSLA